jgi:hypothetical protein
MPKNTIVVFTSKTFEDIVQAGGSQYWRLKKSHAEKMKYLVCTRNAKESLGPELHLAAFLIGRVSGIAETEVAGRYLIQISDYARIEVPELWGFGRNPVHYSDLLELGIDMESLEFEPLEIMNHPPNIPPQSNRIRPLSIIEAKRGLAAAFGVSVEKIEITIRG